jgi:hypothetical protein
VRDIALVPERDVLEAHDEVRSKDPGEARDSFGPDRVLFVRHGRRALLAFGEWLFELQDFSLLEVPELDREFVQAGPEERQGEEDLGVPVALQHLGGHPGRHEAEAPEGDLLDPRVQMNIGPDRAGDPADADRFERPLETDLMPAQFLVPDEELDSESNGLGVDSMRPAHHDRPLVTVGLLSDDSLESPEVPQDLVQRLLEEKRQGGIDDAVGGEPHMDIMGVIPTCSPPPREKR